MKILKLQLLILVLVLFAASSAFADTILSVSINTSSLSGTDGYLYFQYDPVVDAVDSAAIVSSFAGGLLAPSPSLNVVDGSAVSGALPGSVTFANTNAVNDYNHGIIFGNSLNFLLTLSDPATDGNPIGSSTFSLGLFQDEFGASPLITADGTLFATSLMNVGGISNAVFANEAVVTTPEAGSMWLLGSGLVGLIAAGRKIRK